MAYMLTQRESPLPRQRRAHSRRRWSRVLAHVLDRVPTECPLCLDASNGGAPCEGCLHDMHALSPAQRCERCALAWSGPSACPDCSAVAPVFDKVITAFEYVSPIDQLVLQLKSAGRFQHARFMAAQLESAVLASIPSIDGFTIMLPVPSSQQALRRRGFNPAAEIARHLAARLGIAYRSGVLRRSVEGVSQKRLGRAARSGPRAGRYACTQRLDGQTVAVVDDVMTTGATLNAVAKALRAAGAAQVLGIVVARTPYR